MKILLTTRNKKLSLQEEKWQMLMQQRRLKETFQCLISSYSQYQNFNCDETGLYYRLLPHNTLAGSFEKRADGRKKSKDHVTLNACANVSGSIKLPLFSLAKQHTQGVFKTLTWPIFQLHI